VLVMEAIQPSAASAALNLASNSALNVADLRRQECRGDGEQGEYYLESAFSDDRLTICCQMQEAALKTLRGEYGEGYGKPVPGSASDIRGQKYQKAVNDEVIALCKMISMQGLRLTNGHTLILFGELFRIYQKISNKVVGILARARKNRLVHYEGETLWQGQDDEVNVTLLRPIQDITDHLRDTGELLYNREANDLVVLRLRGRLLNTFCVKLNVPMECDQLEENCQTIGNFNLPQTETARQTEVPAWPQHSYQAIPAPETAYCQPPKAPKVMSPIPIRLNKGLRSLDAPRDRIVLDFGSSDLVSSGVF